MFQVHTSITKSYAANKTKLKIKGGNNMKQYYVNKNAQSNGDHEVHESGCEFLPAVENRMFLGSFESCFEAVKEAKKHYKKVDGCYYCSRACHTS
jgi:hypothetical protein